jgi:hypothetical protein
MTLSAGATPEWRNVAKRFGKFFSLDWRVLRQTR